jgi:hypothetical protein
MNFLILILVDILVVFFFFYGTIKMANHATNYLEKIVSNQYVLVFSHIYVICLFYYCLKQLVIYSPVPLLNDGIAIIIVGPMIGTYSQYFVPFMKNVLK